MKAEEKIYDDNAELYEDIYRENFSFGENWKEFLRKLDDRRIREAEGSLREFLGDIEGKRFIDIGCGSGLFSLAAYNLGAKVVSVDVDDNSLWCVNELKKRFDGKKDYEGGTYEKNNSWDIKKGSILDDGFVEGLGKYDVVYSWGVLHHTGNMRKAFDNIIKLVDKDALLYVAIYNDNKIIWEGTSEFWRGFKRWYGKRNNIIKKAIQLFYRYYLYLGMIASGRLPWKYVKNYKSKRGMDFYSDIKDWLGGYPYEYMAMKELVNFFENRGFKLLKSKKARSIGCNEAVLKKVN